MLLDFPHLITSLEEDGEVRSHGELATELATATLSFDKIASTMARMDVHILCQ